MKRSTKSIIWLVVGVLAVFLIWFLFFGSKSKSLPRTVVVERKDIVQEVSFTGHLEAESAVTLGFESPGLLTTVGADVGDRVVAGQRLASLDVRLAQLDLAKAQATKDSTVSNAQLTWQNAQQAYADTVTANNRTLEKQRQAVRDAKAALDQQQAIFQQVASENGDDSSVTESSRGLLTAAQTSYRAAQKALDEGIEVVDKANTAASGALSIARGQYTSSVQAAPGNTGLSALEVGAQAAAISLSKNTLIAPFDGVITQRKGNAHEYVPPGTGVLTVATVDQLKITASVAETDAMKLSVGQKASITFDAFTAAESWPAEIVKIAPAAVMIQGVPTYEVTLRVENSQTKLKPGLTANVTVHANQYDNVLAVPRRAVVLHNEKQVVRILGNDGYVADVPVVTGLIGSDGQVEIISGLSGGEKIVLETPAS